MKKREPNTSGENYSFVIDGSESVGVVKDFDTFAREELLFHARVGRILDGKWD